jgi:hypothetical protein
VLNPDIYAQSIINHELLPCHRPMAQGDLLSSRDHRMSFKSSQTPLQSNARAFFLFY